MFLQNLFQSCCTACVTANHIDFFTFCLGNCQAGVSVMVDDVIHSVTPDTADEFFAKEIMAKV